MPPSSRCTRAAALVLVAAVLAGAGRVLAQARPPLPDPDLFAYRPLDTEDSGFRIMQANMCNEGYTVAGIAFGWAAAWLLLMPPGLVPPPLPRF